jgi:phosphatidylserine/phosphatidylglycerophosphate/cardiolipin synthase-like enzyme
MVRRYFKGWGWGLRTHHVVGASFLASAMGLYPVAASMGLAPTMSTAASWFSSNAPTIESEIESAAKDPQEYSKTLPGKIVNAVETLGAQAAAANGIAFNPQSGTANPQTGAAKFQPSAVNPAPGAANFNKPPAANYAPSGYPVGNYGPAAAYPNYPPAGYPQAGYPYGYSAGYVNSANGTGDIACYFSPAGGCTEACVNEIRQAQQQILVQAYSFTSVPIANALVEAHNRGVAVYIVLDKSQKSEQYSSADFVAHAGIPTLIDSAHAIAHNKVMLIDRQTIITGSFNFTTSAEKSNAENLLIIRGRPDLYQAYENNFRHHYEHSQPYQGRGTNQPSHSHMPATNNVPTNYGQAGGYPAQNQYQQNQYPPNQYQPNPYQSNPNPYGNGGYPQTASPSYPSAGYRY